MTVDSGNANDCNNDEAKSSNSRVLLDFRVLKLKIRFSGWRVTDRSLAVTNSNSELGACQMLVL